jgi:PAS domain-containing protein
MALTQTKPIRGIEAVAERPDGVRVPFILLSTPLFDESGALTGAVNLLVDISKRKRAEQDRQQMQLAAELAATEQLQKISTQLIHADGAEVLYEKILDAAVAIMRSDFASMQMRRLAGRSRHSYRRIVITRKFAFLIVSGAMSALIPMRP